MTGRRNLKGHLLTFGKRIHVIRIDRMVEDHSSITKKSRYCNDNIDDGVDETKDVVLSYI